MPVLDSHAHAFPDALAPGAVASLLAGARWEKTHAWHAGTTAGLLASMDHSGIQRAILCSVATKPNQVPKITAWSAAVASDRLIPFASIHPDYPEPEAEIERIATLGLKGLKCHPQYMNCPIDDPRQVRIARAAAQANLALTLHAGYDLSYEKDDFASPARIRRLHEQVPELRLLACHLGGWQDWEESLTHVVGQRIYLETSYCLAHCPPQTLERILKRHPPEYFLFGTDSPWADQAAELAKFRTLPLTPQAQQAALWGNGHRFIGLPLPTPS